MSKNIVSRIQLRYDSWDKWSLIASDESKILKAGEVAAVSIPSSTTTVKDEAGKDKTVTTAPTVLFKVGDGTSTFGSLPWLSALAADVHDWAKQTEAEFKAWLNNELQTGGVGYATVAQLDALTARVSTLETGLTTETTDRKAADTAIENAYKAADAVILGTANDASTANTVYGAKAAAAEADEKAVAAQTAADNAATAAGAAQTTADSAVSKADKAQEEVDALELVVAGVVENKADKTELNSYYKISDADAKFATGTELDAVESAIETLNGPATTTGSVAAQVKVATDAAAEADEKAVAAQTHSEGVAEDLAAEVDRATKAEAALGVRIDDAETSIGNVDAKFANYVLTSTLSSTVSTLNGKIDAKVATETYNAKVEELEQADTDLDTAVKAAQAKADKAEADAAAAQADIDAFMAGAEQGEAALDTLKEIQAFLESDDGTVQTLLDDVAGLKAADVTLQGNIDKKADQTALDGAITRIGVIEGDYLKSTDVLILQGGTSEEFWED